MLCWHCVELGWRKAGTGSSICCPCPPAASELAAAWRQDRVGCDCRDVSPPSRLRPGFKARLKLTLICKPTLALQLLLDSLEAERQWRRSNWKYLPAGLLLAAGAFLAGAAWHQQSSFAAAAAAAMGGGSARFAGASSSGSGGGSFSAGGR